MRPSHKDLYRLLITIDSKLNILLREHDLSREDALVKAMTAEVNEAISQVPTPEQTTKGVK